MLCLAMGREGVGGGEERMREVSKFENPTYWCVMLHHKGSGG